MKKILIFLLIKYSFCCFCPIRDTSLEMNVNCQSLKCYDEIIASEFCNSDFCLETAIGSEKSEANDSQYIRYQIKPLRLLRFTPIALKAIKSGRIFTPKSINDCGVALKKGSIYYLCGKLLEGHKPVVTSCEFVRKTENLSLSERSFFISGFNKAKCHDNSTSIKNLHNILHNIHNIHRRTTLSPIRQKISKRPSIPINIPQNTYFCLLIPTNALSLNQFLKSENGKKSQPIDTDGQYIYMCPNKFFCIPQSHQLERMSEIKVLESKEYTTSYDSEDEEFKAQMPRPGLPQCQEMSHLTYLVAPWIIPTLESLNTSIKACSETAVDLSCTGNARVTLTDGTRLTSTPEVTTIRTIDGSHISVPAKYSARIRAKDGTESRLARDGSSLTVFPDKTSVSISVEKNINIKMTDQTFIVFNLNGMSLKLPDKTTLISSEYGMIVTTADGKNTLVPVDSKGTEIMNENNEIIINEGLNAEIRTKTGTQVKITPVDTTILSASDEQKASINVQPDGTMTLKGPSGVQLVFTMDQYVNMTTTDGTVLSLGVDDSLYAINSREIIVVFPNANSIVITKDEIISVQSDGTVVTTDSCGSTNVLALDSKGIPCYENECSIEKF